jgi:hypothetical protein
MWSRTPSSEHSQDKQVWGDWGEFPELGYAKIQTVWLLQNEL